ncbi:MAG: aminotransferase class III-fold pyridoxal phosphate-dependent enzyme, partial [Rhodospirillales bacterium]
MPDQAAAIGASGLKAAYRERTPGSARLYAEALGRFPSGISHDIRHQDPHPLYVERAEGARKWDVDGNEYVDYFIGHGALILGHGHPDVTQAAEAQLRAGTHLGASHAKEVTWAGLIQSLMPSAMRVRFTASGTEATLLALRLARAHTGAAKFVRFKGHFHGWHDHVVTGYSGHYDGSPAPGVLADVAAAAITVAAGDVAATSRAFETEPDIAAVIIEPTGAHFGRTPLDPEFLEFLRAETAARGIVLIFDEVVTGFRVAPGGAQGLFGVRPDLTALGKIVAGGLPGGALAGCTEIMERIDFTASAEAGAEKVGHQGTFNANPVSAAAGIAALSLIGDSGVCERANDFAGQLRRRMNEVLAGLSVPWAV